MSAAAVFRVSRVASRELWGGVGESVRTLFWGDVLVVRALFSFCGGRKERGGELL
jgi:hypothetical protein